MNVLVYAFRDDAPRHREYRAWLHWHVASEPFGFADTILSSFIRIVTHPRIFYTPTPLEAAFNFADRLRHHPGANLVQPGEHYWEIFEQLCTASAARGNLISDAMIAALAVEHDCELITTDRDFARFPSVRSRHPLAAW